MMLLRQAKITDLEAFYQMACDVGYGMTSLPKDKNFLKKRLEWSEQSFKKNASAPDSEYYLFMLEDTETGKIAGCSAIESSIGHDLPFYSYKVSNRTRISHELNIRSDYGVLTLVNDHQGKTEICTLYLSPEYRVNGNGLLLSKSRFLFLAQYPHRFSSQIIAEMRGVSDAEGHSPFWENVGQHFFKMPFTVADELTMSTNKQYIADLMPRHPIYIQLLSEKAQEVIGKPHPSTVPAMKILMDEGFEYTNYVDIFDAGPTIETSLKHIKTAASSQLIKVSTLSDEVSGPTYIIASPGNEFRATLGQVLVNTEQQSCVISKEIAKHLQIKPGDSLRISLLKKKIEVKNGVNSERREAIAG